MLPFGNIHQFSLLNYYHNKEVLTPNVANKIQIKNIIKSIFNILASALMVFNNTFNSTVATGIVFVWKLEYTILFCSDRIKFIK